MRRLVPMRNFGDGFADDEVEKLCADIVAF
jgi:hypothetical protein